MSNIRNSAPDPNKRESSVSYQKRISPIKDQIISLGEKNMDNTLWVIRKWLKNEMGLINTRNKV